MVLDLDGADSFLARDNDPSLARVTSLSSDANGLTASNPVSEHRLYLNGTALEVSAADASQIVFNGRGGDDRAHLIEE